MTSLQDGRVAAALFEGLTVIDPRDLKPRPGVADRWTVSDDCRTYAFHLRPEARWSDGRPVTAEDFAWSWRRVLTPATAADYVYMLYPIRGAEAFYKTRLARAGDPEKRETRETLARWPDLARLGDDEAWARVGIGVADPHELVVELERPTAYFLDLAAFSTYLPVRRDAVERHGGRWTFPPNLVSNGAYRLAEWRFRSRMIWEKNPYYWDAASVALGRIELRVFDQTTTALNAYETGAVDLTTVVPALAAQPLLRRRDEGRRRDVLYGTNLGTYFYRFNCSRPPLSDARLRRALALAVDRRAVIERAARGGQMPAFVLVPPGLPGYRPPPGLAEDVQEARRLLAEAGYPGGRGLPQLAILVNKGMDHVPVAEMLQQQWRDRLGLDIRIEQVEWKVFLDMMTGLQYQVARAGWYGDYVDPNTFLDMFVTGGGNNQTGWSNAAYDRLVESAARRTDPAARLEDLRQAEAILLREVPIVPLYYYTAFMLVRPGLEGVEPNLMNRIDFALLRWATPGR
jgi:oligopeptide transport system substrate-binding protein